MFSRDIYEQRRSALAERVGGGLVLLAGNGESPMNYADNAYPFRQDSSFLYYIGPDQPDLAAIVDVESGATTLFGDELTLDQIVWMGALPTLAERAERTGIARVEPRGKLGETIAAAASSGRKVHFLPPYRADTAALLEKLVGGAPSLELIRAVVDQRSRKSAEEVEEIEKAVAVSVAMHEAAIRLGRPGRTEREVAAEVERIAVASGSRIAYPVIGTIDGQTLHNHVHPNDLSVGDLFLVDAGAETALGYAGDLTTTFPVSDGFDGRQQQVYDIVIRAYDAAIATIAPGIPNLAVHFAAARAIFEGMKELGIMRGDTEEALAAGAHALVFPHGIGHMMGLDVHDMEALGEDHVGYDCHAGVVRSTQFGLKSLRLAKKLEPGFVLTIEPGVYFIPQLLDAWKASGHSAEFIDYHEIERWRDFGGIRNEENYLVTDDGSRRLGPRKPQTLEDFRALREG